MKNSIKYIKHTPKVCWQCMSLLIGLWDFMFKFQILVQWSVNQGIRHTEKGMIVVMVSDSFWIDINKKLFDWILFLFDAFCFGCCKLHFIPIFRFPFSRQQFNHRIDRIYLMDLNTCIYYRSCEKDPNDTHTHAHTHISIYKHK